MEQIRAAADGRGVCPRCSNPGEDPAVVPLLFGSGKAVITGATDLEAVEQAVEELHTQLEENGMLGL